MSLSELPRALGLRTNSVNPRASSESLIAWPGTHPAFAIIIALVVAALVIMVLKRFLLDTKLRRQHIASRVGLAARTLIEHPGDRDAAIWMMRAITSSDRFTRCYALETLKDVFEKVRLDSLATSFAEQMKKSFTESLHAEDPFVRHSAASLLDSLGSEATFATNALILTLKNHPNESAGSYAAKALGKIPLTSDFQLNLLRREVLFNTSHQNSLAAESAAIAYRRVTQQNPPEQDTGKTRGVVP